MRAGTLRFRTNGRSTHHPAGAELAGTRSGQRWHTGPPLLYYDRLTINLCSATAYRGASLVAPHSARTVKSAVKKAPLAQRGEGLGEWVVKKANKFKESSPATITP